MADAALLTVRLGGTLAGRCGGEAEFQVEARNVMEMMRRLGAAHPRLKPVLDAGVSVAVDGQIYRDALLQPLKPGDEIYLLPRMAGG